MSTPALDLTEKDIAAPPSRARRTLFRRLADVVCLPLSRVNAFERAMTADLLVDMLREAEPAERAQVAARLAPLSEIPSNLVRLLLRDEISVARALLADCDHLPDGDLVDCIRYATVEHRELIARRKSVSGTVADALAEGGEPRVIEAMLRNTELQLTAAAVEMLVGSSRETPGIVPALLKRPELRPSHAYVIFWWADTDARRVILQRFAASREVLQDAAADVFAMAMEENWQDPISRKALQFIERRQRNRAALKRSRFESLEQAVAEAEGGLSRETAEEISYLCGVKPMTGAKIFTDPGGEPLAIICKSTGLPREALVQLWRALRRPEKDSSGAMTPALRNAIETYDMLAVDRAQTVLRYWNWSLTSAMTPQLAKAIRDGGEAELDEFSVPERTAMLAFAKEIGR